MTPEKNPFYGGTYFPPEPRWGSPGFKEVLLSIHSNWQRQKDKIKESGGSIVTALKKRAETPSGEESFLDERFLTHAVGELQRQYDSSYGGFGPAPKFPTAHHTLFLLRHWKRTRNTESLSMAVRTLTAMANGGLQDHLGGGFHRYSTDAKWQVPHFEKMLYDQALLGRAYLEGFAASRREDLARTARGIFTYILRDMQSEEGAFFSAEDADSPDPYDPDGEKIEGGYFLWKFQEVKDSLSSEEADIFCFHFGIQEEGNIGYVPDGGFERKNILWVVHDLEETARHSGVSLEKVEQCLSSAKKKLFHKRQDRPRPVLDDKILVDWNGLMIAALAYGSRVLSEELYLREARRAADFILEKMVEEENLYHRYREGERAVTGQLDDYAFFVYGLLELWEASFELKYLEWALKLNGQMARRFYDSARGGFFLTEEGQEELIFRAKEAYDGALPSGNSVAVWNLLRLYHLTADRKWRALAEGTIKAFSRNLETHSSAYSQFLCAFDGLVGPYTEIVIAGEKNDPRFPEVRKIISEIFLPQCVLIYRPQEGGGLLKYAPFVEKQEGVAGKITVYVCSGHACRQPVTDLEELCTALEAIR